MPDSYRDLGILIGGIMVENYSFGGCWGIVFFEVIVFSLEPQPGTPLYFKK